jgi:hypothetical protein
MKKSKKNSVATVLAVLFTLGLAGFALAAATKVPLGTADGFAILAGSAISDPAGGAAVVGNVGLDPTGGATITQLMCSEVTGTIYDNDAGYAGGSAPGLIGCLIPNSTTLLNAAKSDLVIAYNNARDAATTTVISADLGGSTLPPGVYGANSSMGLTGTVTLDGQNDPNAVFIFKAGSTLTINASSHVTLINQAQACNVFWQVGSSASLVGAASDFKGTIMAMASISDASGSTVLGRLLARDGAVTLNGTKVTKPTCATVATASVGSAQNGTITVVKTVINDSGGTKVVSDFPLFVNGLNVGHQSVISGETNTFSTNGLYPYTITETSDPNYTATFSGDCDANGFLNLVPGDHKVCLITNNDKGAPVVPPVPPLIDVVKTASPLALPNGPGPVTYTYTLHNMGTVPVTDITMVGDTCSPIVLSSGDTNGDHKLDVSETWVFHCTTTLSATHTNTVVATGWANGISAVDIASATVVVGAPVVPPIIHVTKVPSVFTLPAPGGAVTYSYTVTNPGTAPLSNVSITDNKCTGLPGRVVGHPGDLNKNNLLDPGETWQFTCKSNLTQTTTNIGTAAGSANGLTARDFAIATVVVASPALPSTGLPPRSRTPWDIFITAGILMVVSSSLVLALKKRTV